MGERIDRWKKLIAENETTKKVKTHFEEHKLLYSCVGTGIVVGGVAVLLSKKHYSTPGTTDIKVKAGHDAIVAGKNVVLKNVHFITSNRQGPPSWVIRCIETGQIFASQRSAAIELGVSEQDLSRHLNGLREHINGLHCERICLAA